MGHGLLTVPLGPTVGLLFVPETCGRLRGHGQETVPQPPPAVRCGGTVRRPCPNPDLRYLFFLLFEAIEPFTACPTPVTFVTPLTTAIDGYPLVDGGPGHVATFRIVDVGDGELLVLRWHATTQTSPFELGQGVAPDPERHAG